MTQSTAEAIDLQEVLIIEAHHRFYNSLQVISALASQLTRQDLSNEKHRRTAAELLDRVVVLGKLHRLLGEPHGEDLMQSCEVLCRTLASAYGRSDLRLHLAMPASRMNAGMARGFMLMLAELLTNALKHAPMEVPFDLDVALTSSMSGYHLAVRSPFPDDGTGLAPVPRVASQLAAKLGGALTADSINGYQVRVSLPVG